VRLTQSFDAIEAGEIDDFAFNISARLGRAQIVAGGVTGLCRMTPFSGSGTLGGDPDPGARIVGASFSNSGVYYRDVNGELQLAPGVFAIVRLGPCPVSAAGGTYIVGYQAFLDDGRIIQDSSTVQCVLPGG